VAASLASIGSPAGNPDVSAHNSAHLTFFLSVGPTVGHNLVEIDFVIVIDEGAVGKCVAHVRECYADPGRRVSMSPRVGGLGTNQVMPCPMGIKSSPQIKTVESVRKNPPKSHFLSKLEPV